MTQVWCSASYQQIELDEFINHVREEFSPASLIAKKSMFARRGWGFLAISRPTAQPLTAWDCYPKVAGYGMKQHGLQT